ncbi:uncharacterized protein PAC_19635 [Phialocephala subalpina]|uniref:Uncharacterized protein n=1 Tax=Phialocephala subalpina TaxID=576137 RepID=A0A1L7XXS9_9HELO|nr:uncharacterized protein PAC_19635 [Phialocephala subalpina]
MPKPFPLPLAVGTDICSIPRIQKILTGKHGIKFIRKVLRQEERVENKFRCDDALEKWRSVEKMKDLLVWKGQKNTMHTAEGKLSDEEVAKYLQREIDKSENEAKESLGKAATFMAGRFAAKEAIIKAHERRLYFHDISIRRPPEDELGSKPPIAVVLSQSGKWEDGQEVKLSISHDTDYATAMCLASTATSTSKQFDQDLPSVRRVQVMEAVPSTRRIGVEIVTNQMLHQARKVVFERYRRVVDHAVRIDDIPSHYRASHLSSAFRTTPIFTSVEDTHTHRWGLAIFKNVQEALRAAAELHGQPTLHGQIVHCTYLGDKNLPHHVFETPSPDMRLVAIKLAREFGPRELNHQHTILVHDSEGAASKRVMGAALRQIRELCNGQRAVNTRARLGGGSGSRWGIIIFQNEQDALQAVFKFNGETIFTPNGPITVRCTYLGDEKNDTISDTAKAPESSVDSEDESLDATHTLVETAEAKAPQNEDLSPQITDEEIFSNTHPDKPADFPGDRTVRVDDIPSDVDLLQAYQALSPRAVKVHCDWDSRTLFIAYADVYTAIIEVAKRHMATVSSWRYQGKWTYLGGDIDLPKATTIISQFSPYDRENNVTSFVKQGLMQALEGKDRGRLTDQPFKGTPTSTKKAFVDYPSECTIRIDDIPSGILLQELRNLIRAARLHFLHGTNSALAFYSNPQNAHHAAAKFDGYCIPGHHALRCTYLGPEMAMSAVREIISQPSEVEVSGVSELPSKDDDSLQLTEFEQSEKPRKDDEQARIETMKRLSMMVAGTSARRESQKRREETRSQLLTGRTLGNGVKDEEAGESAFPMVIDGDIGLENRLEQDREAQQEEQILPDEDLKKDEEVEHVATSEQITGSENDQTIVLELKLDQTDQLEKADTREHVEVDKASHREVGDAVKEDEPLSSP